MCNNALYRTQPNYSSGNSRLSPMATMWSNVIPLLRTTESGSVKTSSIVRSVGFTNLRQFKPRRCIHYLSLVIVRFEFVLKLPIIDVWEALLHFMETGMLQFRSSKIKRHVQLCVVSIQAIKNIGFPLKKYPSGMVYNGAKQRTKHWTVWDTKLYRFVWTSILYRHRLDTAIFR